MPWCPQCRAEYREGFARCADCGVDLVAARPEAIPDPRWTEVFSGNLARADVVRGALEAAGIETVAPDDMGAPLLAMYAPTAYFAARLFVRRADLARAGEIIAGLHRLEPEADAPREP